MIRQILFLLTLIGLFVGGQALDVNAHSGNHGDLPGLEEHALTYVGPRYGGEKTPSSLDIENTQLVGDAAYWATSPVPARFITQSDDFLIGYWTAESTWDYTKELNGYYVYQATFNDFVLDDFNSDLDHVIQPDGTPYRRCEEIHIPKEGLLDKLKAGESIHGHGYFGLQRNASNECQSDQNLENVIETTIFLDTKVTFTEEEEEEEEQISELSPPTGVFDNSYVLHSHGADPSEDTHIHSTYAGDSNQLVQIWENTPGYIWQYARETADEEPLFVDGCGGLTNITLGRGALDSIQDPDILELSGVLGHEGLDLQTLSGRRIKISNLNAEEFESWAANWSHPAGVCPAEDSGGGGGGIGYESCEDVPKSRTVGWIICNTLGLAEDFISFMEDRVRNLLRIEPSYYDNDEYYNMWSSFRNFATVAIVATALFMIISTALNFGFFSNYTVKKYLPRLVIGIIFIQVSWPLANILLELSNEAGDGLEFLIGSVVPIDLGGFGLSEISAETLFDSSNSRPDAAKGEILGVVGTVALVSGVGGLGALGFMLGAAGMLLMGFLFLIIRKFIIIVLMIFSPLGLALWVLPGSDNAWKLYRKTFFTLVLLYPIIIAILTTGKVFAWIVTQSSSSASSETGVINFMVASGAFLAGFAAIPFVAKRFSGALGQFTGMVNDKSKGLIDKGKNGIEKRRAARKEWKGARAGERRASRAGGTGIAAGLARARMRLDGGMRVSGRPAITKAGKHERTRAQQAIAGGIEKAFAQEVETADHQLQQSGNYTDPDALSDMANNQGLDNATRHAAAARVTTMQDANSMRKITRHMENNREDKGAQEIFRRLNASGKLFESFGQTAPDIIKGGHTLQKPEGMGDAEFAAKRSRMSLDALKNTSDEVRTNWDTNTWNEYARLHTNERRRQQIAAGDPANAEIGDAATQAEMTKLIIPLLKDDHLRSKIKHENLDYISRPNATGGRDVDHKYMGTGAKGEQWRTSSHTDFGGGPHRPHGLDPDGLAPTYDPTGARVPFEYYVDKATPGKPDNGASSHG